MTDGEKVVMTDAVEAVSSSVPYLTMTIVDIFEFADPVVRSEQVGSSGCWYQTERLIKVGSH